MATFLTTPRMSPALAARIEARVSGRASGDPGGGMGRRARLASLGRFFAVVLVVAVVGAVVSARRQQRRALEASRAALLSTARDARAQWTAEDLAIVPRAGEWVTRSSGAYEGDVIADKLRAPGSLAETLARPIVYVRGGIDAFGSPSAIREAATASQKDPLAVCLVDPPPARTEKALFERVRGAYSRGAEALTPNVRRLGDAVAGLPVLEASWSESVRAAADEEEIERRRRELERTPIESARRAAKSSLLLFALDEAGEPGGPTQLDGERAHSVRVVLVDLASGAVLFRLRRRVDPSWISAARQPEFASALDGCKLATEVYDAVSARSTPDAHAR
jgi:hypothetical protein